MVDTGFVAESVTGVLFGQCQKFAFVGNARVGMDGEIAVVHLIENHVVDGLYLGAFVAAPPFGVGGCEINDGGTFAVYAHSFCPDARGFGEPFAIVENLESIKLAVRHRGYGSGPCALCGAGHVDCFYCLTAATVIIDAQTHGLCCRRPQTELCGVSFDGQLEVIALIHGIIEIFGIDCPCGFACQIVGLLCAEIIGNEGRTGHNGADAESVHDIPHRQC